jgi:hypothetical protein
MKKTDKLRKLTLNRETIQPLDLENVNGGASTGAIVKSAWQSAKAASKWATQNVCGPITIESAMETIRRSFGGGGNDGGNKQ